MAGGNRLSARFGADTSDFKSGITQINTQLRLMEARFNASSAGMGDWSRTATGLESRISTLNSKIELQKSKVDILRTAYENSKKATGENSTETIKAEEAYLKAQETLGKMQNELNQSKTSLENLGKEEKETKGKTDELDKSEEKTTSTTNKFGSAVKTLADKAKNATSNLAGMVVSVIKLGSELALGLAAGALAAAAGIGALIVKSGEWADKFATLSGQTRISTTRLQELDYIGKKLDVDLDTIARSQARMTRNMAGSVDGTGDAAKAFKTLGISITDANGNLRDSKIVFGEVIDALGKVKNPTESDALAMAIFGKSAMELNPLIDAGSEKLANLAAEANNVGAVMSEEAVEALDQFKDSTDALHNTAKGIIGTLAGAFVPVLNTLIDRFNTWLASPAIQTGLKNIRDFIGSISDKLVGFVSGKTSLFGFGTSLQELGLKYPFLYKLGAAIQNLSGILALAKEGFKSGGIGGLLKSLIPEGGLTGIISGLGETIGKLLSSLLTSFAAKPAQLLKIGLDIINGLATGLIAAIPVLLPVFIQLITSFVNFITQTLPMLIEMGLNVVLQVAMGIIQAIPQLVPVVIQIVTSLVQFLITNLPMMINAAVQLLVALANGIAKALPVLIPAVIKIIPAVITTLIQNLPLLVKAALNLILALARGLIAALPVLIPEVPKIVQTIVRVIIENLPLIIGMALTLITTLVAGIVTNLPMIGKAAVDIITTLLKGIVELLPEIVKSAGKIIDTIVKAVKDLLPTILKVGKDIVGGIWQGIQDAWAGLLKDMSGIIAGLPDWVKKLLKIGSPSLVFADIGKDMALGLGAGFENSYKSIRDQIGRAVKDLSNQSNLAVSNFGSSIGKGQSISNSWSYVIQAATPLQTNDDLIRQIRLLELMHT